MDVNHAIRKSNPTANKVFATQICLEIVKQTTLGNVHNQTQSTAFKNHKCPKGKLFNIDSCFHKCTATSIDHLQVLYIKMLLFS